MLALARTSRSSLRSPSSSSRSSTSSSFPSLPSTSFLSPSSLSIGRRHAQSIPHGLVGGTRDDSKALAYENYPEEVERRAERRSPAAVFGTKMMPTISLPSELENKMERLFGNQDATLTRAAYKLFLNKPNKPYTSYLSSPGKPKSKDLRPALIKRKPRLDLGRTLDLETQPLKHMPAQTNKELVFAHASGVMPTQYAIMRNIMKELHEKMGWRKEEERGGFQFLDFAAGYGAGAWASIATFPSPPTKKNTYIHLEPNKVVADLAQILLTPGTPGPVNDWANLYYRSFASFSGSKAVPIKTKKSIAVCSFHLSTMRTAQDRRRVIRSIWNSEAEFIVIAEQAFKDSFDCVSEARDFLLELGRLEKDSISTKAPPPPPVAKPKVEEPAAPQRGRKRPGSKSPQFAKGLMESLSEEDDRIGKPGADGRERFTLHGTQFTEVEFEPEVKPEPESEPVVETTALRRKGDGDRIAKNPERAAGCYVVAPCPHDLACPLASTPDMCHFTQRLEQPNFSRLTKNSKHGTAETKMSYVIIRRGDRPVVLAEDRGEGRQGEVARELMEKEAEMVAQRVVQGADGIYTSPDLENVEQVDVTIPPHDVEKLRLESSEWGRMIYPPIMAKDLIVADLCTSDGSIQRRTYPRSLGRQVWYDMKHSKWGDAVPHAPKSSVAKTRGIRKLAPAHKKNKITVNNNQVFGLAGLSRVEYEDVVQLMTSLGVAIPDQPGKDWKRELQAEKRKEIKTRGWNSSEGWGIGDQIYGYDATAERKKNVDRIVKEAGGPGSLIKKKKKRAGADAEWTAQGGWKPKEVPREALDESDLEWEPTVLEGEMEIDPTAYKAKYPLRNLGLEEEEDDDFDYAATPSYSSNPPTLPPSGARDFDADDLDSLPDVSFASPARIDLSGLGPGWLEETGMEGVVVGSTQQRISANDRLKTFKRLGIQVPNIGRPRTAKDDWALLEAWDGKTNVAPDKPVRPYLRRFRGRK